MVHSVHVLLKTESIKGYFNDLEVLSVIIAAACHDVDHPGLTNQFHVKTNSPLAILYTKFFIIKINFFKYFSKVQNFAL